MADRLNDPEYRKKLSDFAQEALEQGEKWEKSGELSTHLSPWVGMKQANPPKKSKKNWRL